MAASLRQLARRVWPGVLRNWLPRSLWGRALLIILLPIAVMQVAVTWAFFEAHWATVTSRLSDSLAGDIAWLADSYEAAPTPAAFARLQSRAEASMDLSIALQPGRALPSEHHHALFAAPDRALNRALSDRLNRPYWFDTTRYPAYVDVRVKLPQGVLRVIAPRDRAFAAQAGAFVMWLAGATLLLTTVAVLFIRNQVRAIERLAAAAEAFGKGQDVPGFRPHGAREVRQAANAFLDMKARIQRYIDQRTALLASVSQYLYPHTVEVIGSSPITPTRSKSRRNLPNRRAGLRARFRRMLHDRSLKSAFGRSRPLVRARLRSRTFRMRPEDGPCNMKNDFLTEKNLHISRGTDTI